MPDGLRVGPYRPADRAGVRSVACLTGYRGGPIDAFYPDRESFADWATAYFTDREPERALVVRRDDRVVGYMLLTRDARRAERETLRLARRHLLRRFLWARPGLSLIHI